MNQIKYISDNEVVVTHHNGMQCVSFIIEDKLEDGEKVLRMKSVCPSLDSVRLGQQSDKSKSIQHCLSTFTTFGTFASLNHKCH